MALAAANAHLPSPAIVLIAVVVGALTGLAVDVFAMSPLRGKGGSVALIVSGLGVALMLRNITMSVWGPASVRFPDLFAHVLLCWLALLLVRIAETTTGRTWPAMRAELQRLHAISYTGVCGTATQTTEPTKTQRDLLAALELDAPKRILDLLPASP